MKNLNQQNEKPTIAVILPAYNEEMTIEKVIAEFAKTLPEALIAVVDNNSLDQTAELSRRCLQLLGDRGLLLREFRRGKANAIRRAFHQIDVDVYLMVDADLTYPSNMAQRMIEPILAGEYDMVVGDRHSLGKYQAENKRRFHGLGNHLVRRFINILFDASLKDILSGYRAMSRKFVKNYPILVEGFELETEITLHALENRFRILEIPVDYQDRPHGSSSKLSTFSDGWKVILTIFNIFRHYRPMQFFSTLSGLFIFLSLLAGYLPILDYVRDQYVSHLPLAVLASALGMVGIVFMAIGLILSSVSRYRQFHFEHTLLLNKDRV